jgi:hypothetical protein
MISNFKFLQLLRNTVYSKERYKTCKYLYGYMNWTCANTVFASIYNNVRAYRSVAKLIVPY